MGEMVEVSGFKSFDVSSARSSYSGRIGCACGCRGEHTSGVVNPSRVERAARRMFLNPEAILVVSDGVPQYVYTETETRMNIVYLTD